MRRDTLSAISVLDAAARMVPRVATPWMGFLWLTALPLRFCQLYFAVQLLRLDDPAEYLYYLWRLAAYSFGAFVFSLYGRAVFVRACRFAENPAFNSGFQPFKVPLADFVPYLYTALLIELFFYISIAFVLTWPPCILLAGLAAAASHGIGGPKLVRAPLDVARLALNWKPLLGTTIVFALALLLVFINFYALIQLALWLCAPLLGEALPRWQVILSPAHALTDGLVAIGAVTIVEPFWLAAQVELVRKARARISGDDLRLWFNELKASGRKAAR